MPALSSLPSPITLYFAPWYLFHLTYCCVRSHPKMYFAHKREIWVGLGCDSSSPPHIGRSRGAGRPISKMVYPRRGELVLAVTWASPWGFPSGGWLGSWGAGTGLQSLRARAQKLSWRHSPHGAVRTVPEAPNQGGAT
ncbi:hypothetical protein HJG60_010067 [Phyllostomus discolor]|uniref:Uncharacterized protein n=1 Tax=Phyllostomus discolor TaxID=89673 RepID=A0A834ARZ4_9CHIR|nr:hypothetical protein HJG60_010067 [Phyllostomus discolor]